jgi:unsaturated chondroitin disaccharide hydrolase
MGEKDAGGSGLRERLSAIFQFAQHQVDRLVKSHPDYFPMYTVGGKWKHTGETWTNWCEGFLPGMMWIFHERTGEPKWRERAERYSRLVEPRKDDRNVHDLGFLFYHGTYRRWYDATMHDGRPDRALEDVVVHAGRTLAMRFQEEGGYLCSFISPESCFIDIMMNVPVIWYAALTADDRALLDVARRHSETTRRCLVRGDGSTAHEGLFDMKTGEFLRQSTQQGYRSDSCWSRGLAWALYGFATCAKLSGNIIWADTALRCSAYLSQQLADDLVPPWDFDAPSEQRVQKDSSAGAIASAGLFELADAMDKAGPHNAASARSLRTFGFMLLGALCNDKYLPANDPNWEGILKHGVYHIHKKLGVDESVMWGDFFFCDALHRALALLDDGFDPIKP